MSTVADGVPVCPVCGDEMEKGSVSQARGILWLREGEQPPLAYLPWRRDMVLRIKWTGLLGASAPAVRCTTCRRVEFSY